MNKRIAAYYQKLSSLFNRSFQETVNPQLLAVFRVLYATAGIFFAINTIDQEQVLFAGLPGQDTLIIAAWVWLGLAFCLLIGFAGLPVRILHFLIASYVQIANAGVFNVESKFYLIGAFWIIFFDLGKSTLWHNKSPRPRAFPVFFFYFTLSAYVIFGGFISKLFCPLWSKGLGFYYVLQLPWIKPHWFHGALDYEWFVYSMNWVALGAEAAMFILFLFRRTRKLSVLMFYGFAGLLLFLNISNIGTIALSFCVLLLHFFIRPDKVIIPPKPLVQRLDRLSRLRLRFNLPSATEIKMQKVFYAVCLLASLNAVWWGIVQSADKLVVLYDNFGYPKAKKVTEKINGPLQAVAHTRLFRYASYFNQHTTRVRYDDLFTYIHLFDVWEYRVVVNYEDGRKEEPVDLFRADFTSGNYSYGYYTSSRWLQANMYRIVGMVNKAHADSSVVDPGDVWVLNTIKYVLAKSDGSEVSTVDFFVAPIEMPKGYEGAVWLHNEAKWNKLFTYNVDTEQGKWHTLPQEYRDAVGKDIAKWMK